MEAWIWIPITIFAAFFQNLRSALQKHLKGKLSDSGAAYVRFLYALPFVLSYLIALKYVSDTPWPTPNIKFLLFCTIGGICQILFTVLLLWMFSFKSFAVGTTFSKLEIVMVALLGTIILSDTLNGYACVAIAISAFGLIVLSLGQSKISVANLVIGLKDKSTAIGLLSAAFLGGSVVFFRGASLSLETDSWLMAATFTLAISLVIQSSIMSLWLALLEKGEITRVLANWRLATAVGVAGSLASMGWFTAFTIQNASYVRALGQIELLFTFLVTILVFREKVTAMEYIGTALIALGIFLILLKG